MPRSRVPKIFNMMIGSEINTENIVYVPDLIEYALLLGQEKRCVKIKLVYCQQGTLQKE